MINEKSTDEEILAEANMLLVHRYLYYVLAAPVLTDYEYTRRENALLKMEDRLPQDHEILKVGSDIASTYPPEIVEQAEIGKFN